ncbi:hypothetical protein GE061_017711 [Apolygus lucorum]|uniref:Ion transport domain-containing protein n=1 Tax=Apolygus lucorum TaxID=248454 RepID=A0A8S9XDW4_APOLU|nr:hypothetical protein GE061_017711 [Apolygus lucorum]
MNSRHPVSSSETRNVRQLSRPRHGRLVKFTMYTEWRYLSRWRDSMSAASGGCVTRGVCSEMDLSRRGGGGGRRPNPPPQRPQKLAGTPSSTGGHPPSHSFSLVFDPAGRLCYYWSMVVSIAFLYNFWVIIYRFAFQEINRDSILVWFCLDYFADFLYIVDILFHFRTGYLEDGVLQTDSTKLGRTT